MKLVTVEDLREGDVIASDVLNDEFTVVISKGTVIKEPYIKKLRELEIFTIYIEEKEEDSKKLTIRYTDLSPKANKQVVKEPHIVQKEPVQMKHEPAKHEPIKHEPAKHEPLKREPARQEPKKHEPRISMEKITILRDEVNEQLKNKIKDIMELHIYQKNSGLQKLAETAQNIITDILEEDEVIEKVYDVKERSADIYEHSMQVCTISALIALKLGMTEKQVYDISISSLIHDVGLRYLVVRYEDQDINLIPVKEQEEYKKHPIYGYTAIKNETWLSEKAKEIVLNHHERKDSSGYPLGTNHISRMTQIVGVCDEFDELICGVGKARVRVHEALNNIRNYSGIWYDSDIVDAFLQMIAVYPVGSNVRMSSGELGIVMKQNPHFPERPVIRIIKDRFGQAIQGEKIINLTVDTTVVIQEVIK